MCKKLILLLFVSLTCVAFTGSSFKSGQLKYANVKTAYHEKWALVKSKLLKAGVDTSRFEIFIRVFKKEAELEVWAKSKNMPQFKLVETYSICRSSGELGPKRREGDMQVPEGFYQVSIFQPNSAYYLALGINYPNKLDRIKGDKAHPGGDIMIHGNCVTIGCMPLTDDKIKEVYIMAVEARNNGQQTIQVHIFPTHLNDEGMHWLRSNVKDIAKLTFWNNSREGFTYFETKKLLPTISVNDKEEYTFK